MEPVVFINKIYKAISISGRISFWIKRGIFCILRGGFLLHRPGKPFVLPSHPRPHRVTTNRSLRICYAIGTLGPGGAERQLTALACSLVQRGHEVTVLVNSCEGENGHYFPVLEQAGISVLTLTRDAALAGLRKCRKNILHRSVARFCLPDLQKTFFAAGHYLHELRPDILHSYLDYCNICFPLAALMADVPYTRLSVRSMSPAMYADSLGTLLPLMYQMYKGLLTSDRVSMEANSTAGVRDYARWLGIAQNRITYTPNGIEENLFPAANDGAACALRHTLALADDLPLIACVLRMSEEKRPLAVVEVARSVCARHPDVRFLFAGSGPMLPEVQALIARYGLEKQVLLLGRCSNIPVILRASRALLLTSRIEGLPNVVMEAMFSGCPVVASRVGGIPDLVTDGQHGYLYERDDVDGMAEGICRLVKDAALAERMGAAGAQKIRAEFSLTRLVATMESIYRKLLAQQSR